MGQRRYVSYIDCWVDGDRKRKICPISRDSHEGMGVARSNISCRHRVCKASPDNRNGCKRLIICWVMVVECHLKGATGD